MKRIGFLGLGAMGSAMALNLARSGFSVRVWNRTPRDFSDLHQAGALVCREAAEAVVEADLVGICLLDETAVRSVIEAVAPHLTVGTILIDHSTISVAGARALAAQLSQSGIAYVDAPISGGAAGARAATLTIMAGGDRAAFERALPVLDRLGKLVRYMGPSGSGQAAKMVNQLLTAVNQATVAEALHLSNQLGLQLEAVHEVLSASYGSSQMLHRTVPVLQSGRFESPFTAALLHKDLSLIRELGQQVGALTPMTERALDLYTAACASGNGGKDAAMIITQMSK